MQLNAYLKFNEKHVFMMLFDPSKKLIRTS